MEAGYRGFGQRDAGGAKLVLLLAGEYTPTDLTISQSLARGSHIGLHRLHFPIFQGRFWRS